MRTLVCLILVALCACKPAQDVGPPKPADQPFGGAQCSAVRPQTEPDLMAWDSGSRLNLKRLRTAGVAVVRYEAQGCNVKLELLSHCIATGTYGYTPYSANERKVAHDSQELFAQLPVGAASLSGKVKGEHALRTDYMLVGQYALAPGVSFSPADLRGPDCKRATHVVSAMYVGGFAMVAGASQHIDAAATVFGLGAGGGSSENLEHLVTEGNAEACADAQSTEKPKSSCDVPLRLALLEIGNASAIPAPAPARAPALTNPTASAAAPQPAIASPRATGAAPPKPTPAAPTFACPSGMAPIPSGGPYIMRAKKEQVTVSRPFCLDKTEVTVAAFASCVSAKKCTAPEAYNSKDEGYSTPQMCNWKNPQSRDQHPINCVGWKQARDFCTQSGKRLPTEAEWEWAARGGDKALEFPWGDAAPTPSVVNACGSECTANAKTRNQAAWKPMFAGSDNYPETAPVGSYAADSFGLFDMAGNVWEMTASSYYESSGPESVTGHVMRGGSWVVCQPDCYSSWWRREDHVDSATGFRCASAAP